MKLKSLHRKNNNLKTHKKHFIHFIKLSSQIYLNGMSSNFWSVFRNFVKKWKKFRNYWNSLWWSLRLLQRGLGPYPSLNWSINRCYILHLSTKYKYWSTEVPQDWTGISSKKGSCSTVFGTQPLSWGPGSPPGGFLRNFLGVLESTDSKWANPIVACKVLHRQIVWRATYQRPVRHW